MWLSHSRNPSKVMTEVIGIKGVSKDAKLLGEFLTCFAAATSTNHCDGVFLPKGAANFLGPSTYTQVIKEHTFFLMQVAMIPVNLAYNTWFAVIDPNSASDDLPISLNDHLLCQPWFLRIKSVMHNKCLIITTKPNLQVAPEWIDANLESMVWKSIRQALTCPPHFSCSDLTNQCTQPQANHMLTFWKSNSPLCQLWQYQKWPTHDPP